MRRATEKEYLEVILEDMNSKFDLVLEGHASIRGEIRDLATKTEERFDLLDFTITTLNQKIVDVHTELKTDISRVDEKITEIAADLKLHRADTEAHHGVYWVKES